MEGQRGRVRQNVREIWRVKESKGEESEKEREREQREKKRDWRERVESERGRETIDTWTARAREIQ